MKRKQQSESEPAAGGMRRRGFLGAVGATGLGAAIAMFAGEGTAAAVSVGCCNLAYANSGRVSYCLSKSHYVWYCNYSGGVYCTCCEIKNSSGGYIESDASCQY
jgi:hypothetical protein